MSATKILIVDDEKKVVNLIKAYLESEGYDTIVAHDGAKALELFRDERPDLVVLDILMPRMDGLEFCRIVKEESATPIIMLSAKTEEGDRLSGLGVGADDYMMKPFSSRELVARIRAVLRRVQLGYGREDRPIRDGPLSIDRKSRKVELGKEELNMTATEFDILLALASDPGRVFTRRELIERSQEDYFEGYERTMDSHIRNIRKKLKEGLGDWSFIETVYGVGYRFRARKTD